MASRRKGRILAFQALYCWESTRPPLEELTGFAWLEPDKYASFGDDILTFSRLLITGTIENISVIDRTIKKHLQNWDISRVNRVDLAILRMSTYSMIFQKDVAFSIIVDEAIGIAKEFGTDESFRFVNGVLDGIHRGLSSQQQPEAGE
jgi:N utilization substance protein B